jgi:hypothetical protein
LLILYAITLFLSAGLLFLVQPLFAKMVLPLLGGTPAVWSTCMVFFQAALVAGYAYAHVSTKLMGVRKQALLHAAVMLVPLFVLPLAVPEGWRSPTQGNPIGWLLGLLAAAIGLPFFVVASTAPLLQKWFTATRHPTARDPYHLYAASNCGSMAAVLAYPLLFEPTLRLGEQRWVWSRGYALLTVLIWGCAIALRKSPATGIEPLIEPEPRAEAPQLAIHRRERAVSWGRRLRWTALTAAPSSLMLGVTTYITTDIAVVPLLWVIPLALYLLTFILVFARRTVLSHRWMLRLLPIAVVVMLLVLLSEATEPVWLVVCLHLAVFFIATMVCHGELAHDRPDTSHLTEYYLLMSIGGMLGGVFNALVAPMLFTSIAEYPVALIVTCVLVPSYRAYCEVEPGAGSQRMIPRVRAFFTPFMPRLVADHWPRIADILYPVLLGVATIAVVLRANGIVDPDDKMRLILTAGLPAVVCFVLSGRPVRFGLAVGAVLFAGHFDIVTRGMVMEAHRSFFGVHRITRYARALGEGQPDVRVNQLFHGTTLHGMQFLDEWQKPDLADQPLTYYHRNGPIGQIFRAFREDDPERLNRVGIVGLGPGGLLAYGEAGDRFSVYELDPVVETIATNARFFTFYNRALERKVDVPITLGDARLKLAEVGDGAFDLLILDAFSSDSIPVHLLTKEAVEMYLKKLDERGLLAFHISNRYLRLEPVMAALANALELICVIQNDTVSDRQRQQEKYYSSDWVVMAKSLEDLKPLGLDMPNSKWRVAASEAGFQMWTDDFSNILSVFDWGFEDPDRER